MATDPDKIKRRQDAQRGLMVSLMDMEDDMKRFEANVTLFEANMTARVATWKKDWKATYRELDEAMDQEG